MRNKVIQLFMWGYQSHYCFAVEFLARSVLKELGVAAASDTNVLIVGTRRPRSDNPNSVCIEPEHGIWPAAIFDGLLSSVEKNYEDHPSHKIFYSDEASMREKPEKLRRASVTSAVGSALSRFDEENGVQSFCGNAYLVGDYYVTPVIQVPEIIFHAFPPLTAIPNPKRFYGNGFLSLIHAAISAVLNEASLELLTPEPGHSISSRFRSAEEIIRIAARNFMHTPGIATTNQYTYTDLFDRFNLISSLFYEGSEVLGHIILANPKNPSIDYLLQFKDPIPFREPRWARKALHLATKDIALIADGEHIYGLGKLTPTHNHGLQDIFRIDFLDHYHWELSIGPQVLLRSQYGAPKLPFEVVDEISFKSNYARLFPRTTPEDHSQIWSLFTVVIQQKHGSMIVVAEDAANEAHRLARQGTSIQPIQLTAELLRQVSAIDGTIIMDTSGMCYAIGVILDGLANDECTPSRGSRFNSAVRYVDSKDAKRLAIVVSDDRTVDIFPMLNPMISRTLLDRNICEFEKSALDNYHKSRSWLHAHRFYLNSEQCTRVNIALERLNSTPKEVGEIYLTTAPFEVDPASDDSYLSD